ncbi:MAG: prephenate dehydratase [Candidatus Omnitrophota bacterium]|nr:MAG: prephenate dehydratase [Candidatus Omnitrophota bacterium]
MKLKKLREKIDKIDSQILKLLNERAKEVMGVSQLKKVNNLQLYSPEREALILSRLKKINKGPLVNEDVEMIFREVVSVCRSLRAQLKIAYLGPEGTFTHLAAIKKFGKKLKYIPAESIPGVFEKVEKGEVDYGVVPIENSIEGVVNYTLDMFFSSPLKVCAEIVLNISHSLLGTSGKKIKRIYSNPQVFAQCRKWISQTYPNIELVPTASTAKAAQAAKKDPQGACIGNSVLAGLYGLKVIASSIEDSSSNITRFLVIAKNDSPSSGKDKTSILFSIKDRVGALHDVLFSFKKHRINLTKIESRPSKKKPWDYYFFVDFEGHRESALFKKALKELEKGCIFVKILGSYPKES